MEQKVSQISLDKLKENNIMPIDITQVGISLRKNKQRKNMAQAKEIFKEVNMAQIKTKKEVKNKPKTADSIKKYFEMNQKVTTRDIVIFSQDFYLLKKAKKRGILLSMIEEIELKSKKAM